MGDGRNAHIQRHLIVRPLAWTSAADGQGRVERPAPTKQCGHRGHPVADRSKPNERHDLMDRVQKWEPGDVGMWNGLGIVFRCLPSRGEAHWVTATAGAARPSQGAVRPLVVIDPENREQVERLISAIGGDFYYGDTVVMQMALREFANPTPRIEEPRALGAVVEDGAGKRWTLSDPGSSTPWRVSDGSAFNCSWASIAPVRVLSEGVPAEASE